MDTTGPLEDLRVVEVATGIAGGYAGKLFVDAGAEVVKVEPAGGDDLRRWTASGSDLAGADGPLFRHLAAGKSSVVGQAGDPHVEELLAAADLVIESGDLDVEALRRRHPRVVVVSVTPFGRSGPLAERPATEFTVQAECGSLAARGELARPPVQAGGRVAEWAAGLYGAVAALAAVEQARRTGEGRAIDASWMEAMTLSTNLFADPMFTIMGMVPPTPPRNVETPSIHPTSDGWVGFNTNGPQHAEAFLHLIDRPDLIEAGYVMASTRMANRLEFEQWVNAYTSTRTTAEVLERAGELRVPAARVNDARTLLEEEHLVARRFYRADASGAQQGPSPHYLIDGERMPLRGPAPVLGSGGPSWSARPAAGTDRADDEPGVLPLAGLKVLDITSWWAGPSNTQLLGALGADVIHVESIAHPDPMRYAAAVMFLDRERWWELSSFYLTINTDKRGITLDLGDADAVALAKRLVEWADVVVENYTPRVMPKFGLGWDVVHALNPRAVMVRMPAFGLDGPWAERLGFAQNMEQVSGMATVTGHADAEPLVPRGPCDPLGGAHAAFATMVALARREQAGTGSLVEVPLVEGALNLTAEQVVEYTATGHVMGRMGNRSPHCAPQGLYACAGGEEQWLAVSVADDDQWQALCKALGRDDWAGDPSLADRAGRHRRHDELDAGLAAWAAGTTVPDAVESLLAAGVPAAALADPRDVHTHPQFQARRFCEDVPHVTLGSLPLFGMPFRMEGVEGWIRRPAPTMGEHNQEVLGGLLGLSDDDMDRLRAAGVVGDRPAGV
jgi:crotonobetainyl-CoA:carnitine CoA-transferase CaiB-like acyl-CoA transferase